MARGIDAKAHEVALASNGKTIAVLGSGIDYPYPKVIRPYIINSRAWFSFK